MPTTERSFRTPAIILKRRDFGEADRLLTILTPQYGKLDVIAKGARKPTSAKTGHVELFTRADMLIHSGRELGIAVQAEMDAPYLALREDLARGAYASYVVELLDRFTAAAETDFHELFTLLDDTLERLCSEPDPRLVTRFYEVHLLDLSGFRPELTDCVISRDPVEPRDQFFSYDLGGVVSPAHAHDRASLAPISMTCLKLLRHLQRSTFAQVKNLKLDSSLHDESERILLGYITFLLERKLLSVDFIRRIRRL